MSENAVEVAPSSPDDTVEAKRGTTSNILLTMGRRAIVWIVTAILASLALAFIELGIALFLQLFLKNLGLLAVEVRSGALLASLLSTPSRLALGLVVLAIARSVTLFLVQHSGNVSTEMIAARLRRVAVWETLLHPDKRFVPAASVNARVGDLAAKASQCVYSGAILASSIVQTIALSLAMLFVAPGETVIAMLGLGLLGALVMRLNRVIRQISARVPRELRILTEGIERIARNITLVRVLRTEKQEHGRLSTSIDTYARHMVSAAYIANFAGALTPFVGILLIIGIVVSSQGVLHTPGVTLLSFLYLFVRFVQTLTNAVQCFSTCNTTWPSFKDSLDYVGKFPRKDIESAVRQETPAPERVDREVTGEDGAAPDIDVRGVTFAYAGTTTDVLRNVSTRVSAGAQLAIVGPSGCGKSTLLGLVMGLWQPQRGEIRIGGRRPAEYFDDPTTRIGYVGAESFLIAGSIRDNLKYGLPRKAADEDLWSALAQAELKTTVEELDGKLEYLIAEDGSGLSMGQKQRLCLARALLGKPHLLVLDEVSANLDTETERAIAEMLRGLRGATTTIIVSHREAILAYADSVVRLDGPDASPQ